MSSRSSRVKAIERQITVTSDGKKRKIVSTDSIDTIVAKLLHGEKAQNELPNLLNDTNEENIVYETMTAKPQNTNICHEVHENSCENCKSYFPLLKSFILHLESSHKSMKPDVGVTSYECELCTVEFDSSLRLGMHSLLHVSGKSMTRDVHGNINSSTIFTHGNADANQVVSSDQVGQVAYTQLMTTSPPDHTSFQEAAEDAMELSNVRESERRGSHRSPVQDSAPLPAKTRKSKRGLGKAVSEQTHVRNLTTFVPLKENGDSGSNTERIMSQISVLLPALQERVCEIAQQQSDVSFVDDIIRPRGSSSLHVDDSPGKSSVDITENKNCEEGANLDLLKPSVEEITRGLDCVEQSAMSEHYRLRSDADDVGARDLVEKRSTATPKRNERNKRNVENQCIICLEKFPSKELLRSHKFSHGDQEKWTCDVCDRQFTSHWKYHDHSVKIHGNKKPFKCDVCGKCLSSFTILAVHKGLHSDSRPYGCELCGKRYLVAAGLRDHMIAHKNERVHRCCQCGAAFNAKGDLKKHMVTHMAERPHTCPVCNTGFNRSASLRRHMRSHTGEKPFQCDMCDKAFSRKEKMQEHRRTHTGERPLICGTCGKSFKDSSNYSNHKKIHVAGYVPRKRKRSIATSKPQNINSVIIPNVQPATPSMVASPGLAGLVTQKSTSSAVTGKENALKDFATISTTIEDLQSASQECLRQILGAHFDQNEFRSLANAQAAVNVPGSVLATAQAAVNVPGGVFNLPADDVRSLQMIINGVQARNAAVSIDSSVPEGATQ